MLLSLDSINQKGTEHEEHSRSNCNEDKSS